MFGLVLAFKNYKISAGKSFVYSLFHSDWAGLENFSFFLKSNQFSMILRNTLLYNIVFIILGIVLPVALAIMINNIYSKRKSKTYQTMMFLPHFMSWVVVSYFVYAFLSPERGLMNSILQWMGKDPVRWYSEAKYWPYILVFMQVWKTLGYNMVVYLASITGIDTSLYEAAVLDGASKMQQARYITLPSLKPIIIMMFILSVGRIFSSDFGLFYQVPMNSGPLLDVTNTIDTYVYRGLMSLNNISMASAAGVYQSLIGFLLVLAANFIVKKSSSENALF